MFREPTVDCNSKEVVGIVLDVGQHSTGRRYLPVLEGQGLLNCSPALPHRAIVILKAFSVMALFQKKKFLSRSSADFIRLQTEGLLGFS